MNEASMLYNFLLVGAALFALGLVGFLVRRNLIVMFLCAEMMLQGVSVSLVGWGQYHAALNQAAGASLYDHLAGTTLVIFIITVAACEAAIAMALVLMLAQRSGKLDSAVWQDLREEGQPAYVDRRVPEELEADQIWPTLTPAGRRPAENPQEETHRSKV